MAVLAAVPMARSCGSGRTSINNDSSLQCFSCSTVVSCSSKHQHQSEQQQRLAVAAAAAAGPVAAASASNNSCCSSSITVVAVAGLFFTFLNFTAFLQIWADGIFCRLFKNKNKCKNNDLFEGIVQNKAMTGLPFRILLSNLHFIFILITIVVVKTFTCLAS